MTRKPIREKRWMMVWPDGSLDWEASHTRKGAAFPARVVGGRVIQVEIREVVKKRKARKR